MLGLWKEQVLFEQKRINYEMKSILWKIKRTNEACLKNAVNFCNMNFRDFLHAFEYKSAGLMKVKIEGKK